MPRPEFSTLIITGGSSGIGHGILEAFLRRYPDARAINLSRRPPAIDEPARLHHLEADLSQREAVAGAAGRITRLLDAEPSGRILLVNNSGVGIHQRFHEADHATTLRTIDLNLAATVQLTLQLLPSLTQRGGSIVNLSSTSAFQPTPWMATYGAGKAFLLNWTLALGEDLRGSGVQTLALCPGGTRTPFLPQAGLADDVHSYWGLQSVEQVVDALFRGLARRRSVVVPGRMNRLMAALAHSAPTAWSTAVAGHILRRAKT